MDSITQEELMNKNNDTNINIIPIILIPIILILLIISLILIKKNK